RIAVVLETVCFLAGRYVPEFDHAIIAGGGQRFAVGVERYGVDQIGVRVKDVIGLRIRQTVWGDGVNSYLAALGRRAAGDGKAAAVFVESKRCHLRGLPS